MTEPHRFTSIITCLSSLSSQIVRQTPDFRQGQTFVLPILMSVLPGIDANDFKKTSITLQFLKSLLMVITCADCSSAVNIRNDLDEVRITTYMNSLCCDLFTAVSFTLYNRRLKKRFVYRQPSSKILSVNF